MATKRDLQNAVDFYNERYCKKSKNMLVISQAYGGYSVVLTGKRNRKTHRPLVGSLGTAVANVGNAYHDTATNTLNRLYKEDSRGYLKSSIEFYDRRRH